MYQSRAKNPPQLDFWEAVIYIVFAAGGFVVGVLAYLGTKSMAKTASLVTSMASKKPAVTRDEPQQAVVAPPVVSPLVEEVRPGALMPAVDWDEPEIVPSEIRRVELSKGFVVVRYNPATGTSVGKLTVTSKTLQKTLGTTLRISSSTNAATVAQATNDMKAKAEALFTVAKTTSKRTTRREAGVVKTTSAPEHVIAETPPNEPLMFDDVPPHVLPEIPPYFDERDDMESAGPDPFVGFASTSDGETRAGRRSEKVVAKVNYRGTLLGYGKEKRLLPGENGEEEREVKHFCVRIRDDDLMAEQPLWGNDLRRVLKEAHVRVGDRIDLGIVGEVPVLINGETKMKKVWSLKKL